MSQKEVDQIGVFEKLANGEISQAHASSVLRLGARQVRRKMGAYLKSGAASLIHGARGKPSNRALPAELAAKALGLVKEKYPDFGPTLAAEKLLESDDLKIGKETLRKLMTEAGLWKPKDRKQGDVHLWRERRGCFGELVQADGSYHRWFEERGESCCLLAFIDDATSRLVWLEFCESESTECLMQATWHYLEAEGRPVELYVDRGGVYKVNICNEEGEKETQYARSLRELEIGLIFARSPQAKGRVERVFETLQDRLVKELRLRGISAMAEANAFLKETYLPSHNQKFAAAPREQANLHRSLEGFSLPAILCTKETRVLQADRCVSYRNRWLQVEKRQPLILGKKERITVSQHLDQTLHLSVRDTNLAFKELLMRPAKPLREKQPDLRHVGHRPAVSHPWKKLTFGRASYKPDISTWPEPDISILV